MEPERCVQRDCDNIPEHHRLFWGPVRKPLADKLYRRWGPEQTRPVTALPDH